MPTHIREMGYLWAQVLKTGTIQSPDKKTPLVFVDSTVHRNWVKINQLSKEILCQTICSEVIITPKTGSGFWESKVNFYECFADT